MTPNLTIQSFGDLVNGNHMFISVRRFEELVKKFTVEYYAGGATQNSIKVAQVSHVHTQSFAYLQFFCIVGLSE